MSGLEERILTLVKELEEEKRLADKRAKQLYLAAGGGSFISHADTPAAYAGQAGKFVKVNAVPDALIFASLVKADITNTPWAWGDVSKTGSNLTDLATRQHAGLTDITSDQHHAQLHAIVGGDHSAAGLTIGHVIRATGAAAFAWAQLQHGDLGGVTSDLHHPQAHTLASHSSKAHSELTGVTSDQHHPQVHAHAHGDLTGISADQHHPQAHTLASHSTKPHSALTDVTSGQHHAQLHGSSHHSGGGDAIKLDDLASPDDNADLNATTLKHGLLMKLGGGTVNYLRADGAWAAPTPGAHAASHHVGGGDLVNHDSLTGFVAAEHKSLPNTIAQVLSDHTLAVHNALAIDHGSLSGKGDDDHPIYYNSARHTQAIHTALSLALTTRPLDNFGACSDNILLNATTAKHGLLMKLGGGTANFLRADGAWSAPTVGAHAASHHVGGSDLVNHDSLTDFVANEHINHGNVSMIAGSGLSGGGTIATSRTFNLGALTAAWDAGSYQIRALRFYSDQAPGTAPFTVVSTTKVTNLNADLWDGYQFADYINQAVLTSSKPQFAGVNLGGATYYLGSGALASKLYTLYVNKIYGDVGAVGTPSYTFNGDTNTGIYQGGADNLCFATGGALRLRLSSTLATLSLPLEVPDHTVAGVDRVVNVSFGTGDPPVVTGTTRGSLFVKYTA